MKARSVLNTARFTFVEAWPNRGGPLQNIKKGDKIICALYSYRRTVVAHEHAFAAGEGTISIHPSLQPHNTSAGARLYSTFLVSSILFPLPGSCIRSRSGIRFVE